MMANSLILTSIFMVPFSYRGDYPSRYGSDVLLMLVTVAFSNSVSGNLPNVPYMTIMDRHMNGSLAFIWLLMVLHAYEAAAETKPTDDLLIHGVLFVGWVIYHAVLLVAFSRKSNFNAMTYGVILPEFSDSVDAGHLLPPLF